MEIGLEANGDRDNEKHGFSVPFCKFSFVMFCDFRGFFVPVSLTLPNLHRFVIFATYVVAHQHQKMAKLQRMQRNPPKKR